MLMDVAVDVVIALAHPFGLASPTRVAGSLTARRSAAPLSASISRAPAATPITRGREGVLDACYFACSCSDCSHQRARFSCLARPSVSAISTVWACLGFDGPRDRLRREFPSVSRDPVEACRGLGRRAPVEEDVVSPSPDHDPVSPTLHPIPHLLGCYVCMHVRRRLACRSVCIVAARACPHTHGSPSAATAAARSAELEARPEHARRLFGGRWAGEHAWLCQHPHPPGIRHRHFAGGKIVFGFRTSRTAMTWFAIRRSTNPGARGFRGSEG